MESQFHVEQDRKPRLAGPPFGLFAVLQYIVRLGSPVVGLIQGTPVKNGAAIRGVAPPSQLQLLSPLRRLRRSTPREAFSSAAVRAPPLPRAICHTPCRRLDNGE